MAPRSSEKFGDKLMPEMFVVVKSVFLSEVLKKLLSDKEA